MLKYRKTFEKFLAACSSSKNTGLPRFFSKVSDNCIYFKNINFLTKTKRCLYAEFYEFKLTKMTSKDKQNHIFRKSKSYKISNTVIFIGEGREFIIHVFYWCIPLDHEIYTKCKNISILIKGISSHNIYSGIKSQKSKKHSFVFHYQKRLIFLRIRLFHFN